jgi:hypothetical protein
VIVCDHLHQKAAAAAAAAAAANLEALVSKQWLQVQQWQQ